MVRYPKHLITKLLEVIMVQLKDMVIRLTGSSGIVTNNHEANLLHFIKGGDAEFHITQSGKGWHI